MLERTLFYSPLAKQDLDEIFDYITYELENPFSATETVNAILDAAESIEGFPFVGSPVKGLPFYTDEYLPGCAKLSDILSRDGLSHIRGSHPIQPSRLFALARPTIGWSFRHSKSECKAKKPLPEKEAVFFYSPQSRAAMSFMARQFCRKRCAAARLRFMSSEEIPGVSRKHERISSRPAAISRLSSAEGS